jgi:putative oxidoreductase
MKKLFNTNYNHGALDVALLILRVGIAIMMITHGYPKLVKLLSGEEIKFADPYGMGVYLSILLAVFAEIGCSILIFLGLATRLATIPLIITMLTTVFIIHAEDGFGVQELSLHYLIVYVFLLISGAGRFSIDSLIGTNKGRRRR